MTTCSDGSRPPVPIDRDRRDGVVTKTEDAQGVLFLPRNIDDAPLDDQEADTAGYLTPTVAGGLGKPMTPDDAIRALKAAGWTDADIDHVRMAER